MLINFNKKSTKFMSELSSAIRAVCEEKGLNFESVLETIEYSLAAAYRKDFGHKNQNIKVDFDPETGEAKIRDVKTVVEDLPEEEEDPLADSTNSQQASSLRQDSEQAEQGDNEKKEEGSTEKKDSAQDSKKKKEDDRKEGGEKSSEFEEEEERKFNPKTEIQLSEAKELKKNAKAGEEISIDLETPEGYGRMAAQTAKQVIIQKLREAERENIYNEFKEKEKEVVNGIVQRREGRNVLVDLGRAVGQLPPEEQVYGERYNSGERIKVYIKEVNMESRGPRIVLSRASSEIVKALFYLEIPELNNGTIEIKDIARSPGSRSKVAVYTEAENIDPIGSCVGQRGSRIQTIITELGGEKIDIIEYNEDQTKYIANSLSPAKVVSVDLDEKNKQAGVKVASDQFSLAIGKRGENIRLASELTGWKINIKEEKEEGLKEEEAKEISSEEVKEEETGAKTEEAREEAEKSSSKEDSKSKEKIDDTDKGGKKKSSKKEDSKTKDKEKTGKKKSEKNKKEDSKQDKKETKKSK